MSDNPLLSNSDPRRRENPFVDASGNNPFAEEGTPPPLPSSENPYAATSEPGMPAERVAPFETTQAPRGNLLLLLAGSSSAAELFTWGCWWRETSWGFVLGAATAVLSIVTVNLAYSDLAAMRAKAMESTGRWKTELAFWICVAAFLLLALLAGVVLWEGLSAEE